MISTFTIPLVRNQNDCETFCLQSISILCECGSIWLGHHSCLIENNEIFVRESTIIITLDSCDLNTFGSSSQNINIISCQQCEIPMCYINLECSFSHWVFTHIAFGIKIHIRRNVITFWIEMICSGWFSFLLLKYSRSFISGFIKLL